MIWLILSLLALCAGPLFYAMATSTPSRVRAIDGFVFVTVPGLILLDALPSLATQAGWLVFVWAAVGLFVPNIIETAFRPIARSAHMATVWLAVIGLVVHTLVDGAALAAAFSSSNGTASGEGLALAVVIHRLPVGLAVWWVARPAFGYRWATTLLVVMLIGTVSGYFVGAGLAHLHLPEIGVWFQALVAGAILHTVVFRPHLYSGAHDHSTEAAGEAGQFSGLGDLAGWLLLVVLLVLHASGGHEGTEVVAHAHSHGGDATGWIERLIDLTLLSAPALLIAYILGGLLSEYMPAASIRWTKRGGTLSQSMRGMAVGLPLPICSCGVVPLYRQLVNKGAPPAAAYAFLVATPELGIDALLLSIPLLGWEMSGLRVLSAAVVALLVGWVIGLWFQRHLAPTGGGTEEPTHHSHDEQQNDQLESHEHCCAHRGPRWKIALKEGCVELVDRTAPWILLGLVVAAIVEPWMSEIPLDQIPDGWEVLICALIGMPIYICASGATPMVAGMIAAGVSPGAAIAFLLTGPATNVSTFGVIKGVHGKKAAFAFVGLMATASIAIGLLVNGFTSHITLDLPELFSAEHGHGPIRIISAILLLMLVLASIYRRGSREFLREIWA